MKCFAGRNCMERFRFFISSLPGLTRQSIEKMAVCFEAGWMPGSSPGMTRNLSFRDGPKDQTSGAQLHPGNLEIPGSMLRIAPE